MKQILITGANRGIGLELVRQCLQNKDFVFATCREPKTATQLTELQKTDSQHLVIIQLDVTDTDSIKLAAKEVAKQTKSLDLLFNNAGMQHSGEHIGNISADMLLKVLHTNAVGPMLVAQSFVGMLKKGRSPKIVSISSQLGSIERKRSGGRYAYDGSKAALNMFTRTLAFELEKDGIITIMMHPGWVRTDMGGDNAPLSVEESVSSMLKVTNNLDRNDVGRFLQWDGKELPW